MGGACSWRCIERISRWHEIKGCGCLTCEVLAPLTCTTPDRTSHSPHPTVFLKLRTDRGSISWVHQNPESDWLESWAGDSEAITPIGIGRRSGEEGRNRDNLLQNKHSSPRNDPRANERSRQGNVEQMAAAPGILEQFPGAEPKIHGSGTNAWNPWQHLTTISWEQQPDVYYSDDWAQVSIY